jgi:hypothetical protein
VTVSAAVVISATAFSVTVSAGVVAAAAAAAVVVARHCRTQRLGHDALQPVVVSDEAIDLLRGAMGVL